MEEEVQEEEEGGKEEGERKGSRSQDETENARDLLGERHVREKEKAIGPTIQLIPAKDGGRRIG